MLKAVPGVGSRAATAEHSATLQVFPVPPGSVTATAANGSATLHWTAAPGATQYDIYEGTSSGGEYFDYPEDTVYDGAATSYTVTNLMNGAAYYFVITARDSVGEIHHYNEVMVTQSS